MLFPPVALTSLLVTVQASAPYVSIGLIIVSGDTGKFKIIVGVQGSCISPLLFIIVMDVVLEHI